MGEAINLVENFKVEKVIFNCGKFNELELELIQVLNKKEIPYYSCIKELNIDNNKLYLELHYAGQRHGEKLFHAIVYNLEESDLPEINDYLKRSWDYLRKMWAEVDGTTTEELAK